MQAASNAFKALLKRNKRSVAYGTAAVRTAGWLADRCPDLCGLRKLEMPVPFRHLRSVVAPMLVRLQVKLGDTVLLTHACNS